MDRLLNPAAVPDLTPAKSAAGSRLLGSRLLALLESLVSALDGEAVAYCYWKSCGRLEAALSGQCDLDLLVSRSDQHRAATILLTCGFKLFPDVALRNHPSTTSYVGYDAPSGRLVHVHLHVRLISGEALLRNYRIRFEDVVLREAIRDSELRIRRLDRASEAVVLAIRSCLERHPLDPVALRNWRGARAKFDTDRVRLALQTDRASVSRRAAALFTALTTDMLTTFIFEPEQSQAFRRRLRRRVKRELASDRMYNGCEARLRSIGRAAYWAVCAINERYLHAPRPRGRRAPGGGCVVALLGVDGSGKTTVTAAVRAWLGAEVGVMPVYLGTGDGRPSLVLWPLKAMLPLCVHLVRRKPRGASHGPVSDAPPGLGYTIALMVWATVLAIEKRIKLHATHRGAARGLVVIADRYPQDMSPDYNDGPLLRRLPWAPGFLRRFEARAYALARRLPPDLVIKLQASPDLLERREPTMNRRIIEQRVDALAGLQFPNSRVVHVDAAQPLADVLRAVKREVWALL